MSTPLPHRLPHLARWLSAGAEFPQLQVGPSPAAFPLTLIQKANTMKTRSELQAERDIEVAKLQALRDQAGAAYAAAAQGYVDAWIELHTLDIALASRTGSNSGFGALPVPAGHPKYLREPVHGDAVDRTRPRLLEITAGVAAAESAISLMETAEREANAAHVQSLKAEREAKRDATRKILEA